MEPKFDRKDVVLRLKKKKKRDSEVRVGLVVANSDDPCMDDPSIFGDDNPVQNQQEGSCIVLWLPRARDRVEREDTVILHKNFSTQ